MATWSPFISPDAVPFDVVSLQANWPRLHRCDAEPMPEDGDVLQAWVLFHNGDFQQAAEAGLKAGTDGVTVANKATSVYARFLEKREKTKLDLFLEVAARAEAQQALAPSNPNAFFWQAYALSQYSQAISVAKGMAQGVGNKVKEALNHTIELCPEHADAHLALATFHAEVIDKVGALIAGMTYGAKKETGLALFKQALQLNPGSPVSLIDYANGLVMLEGDKKIKEATKLYQQAVASKPQDALERLGVALARVELQN
jgi:tetratricopeptide (TPR) repeat protein